MISFLLQYLLDMFCCRGQCEAVKQSPEAEGEPSRCFTSKTESFPTGGRFKSRSAAVTGAEEDEDHSDTSDSTIDTHRERKSIQHRNTAAAAARGFTCKTISEKTNLQQVSTTST